MHNLFGYMVELRGIFINIIRKFLLGYLLRKINTHAPRKFEESDITITSDVIEKYFS